MRKLWVLNPPESNVSTYDGAAQHTPESELQEITFFTSVEEHAQEPSSPEYYDEPADRAHDESSPDTEQTPAAVEGTADDEDTNEQDQPAAVVNSDISVAPQETAHSGEEEHMG